MPKAGEPWPHVLATRGPLYNNFWFLRNRSGTALGYGGLLSAALVLIISHISDCSFYEQHCSFLVTVATFFASETFTWYHHCSQHSSGYGHPEAMVK